MGVSGQRLAPAALYPRGKGPPVPIVQEAGWAPEPVWTQRLEEVDIYVTHLRRLSSLPSFCNPVISSVSDACAGQLAFASMCVFTCKLVGNYKVPVSPGNCTIVCLISFDSAGKKVTPLNSVTLCLWMLCLGTNVVDLIMPD
jgi:hypothetical protein